MSSIITGYNPDVLSCLANLSNDEVFTPPEVANAMLDMLPQELFRDPNTKFLDPACKSGVFLREIAKRLIDGLADQIPNLQERIDHIFHEQLYGIAMEALMRIEGFRSLNQDIETIINKSEKVKQAKKEKGDSITPKEKKELTEEEKEYKSLRKQIQEKLIKFATRVPIFMYLTDFREQTLVDVITQLEPGLFKKVTGLDVKDFELLCSLNVFNADLMNDAIYKFKRYEDSSLSYTGINRHEGEKIGLFNTVINYDELFIEQQATTEAPPVDESDIPDTFLMAAEPLTDYDEEEEEEPVREKKPKKEKKTKTGRNGEVVVIQAAKPKTTAPDPKASAAYVDTQKPKPAPAVPQTPAAPAKPAFDAASVRVGTKVFHKAFGHGTVTEVGSGKIRVSFNGEMKPFMFPAAFLQGFLKVEE